MLDIRQSVTQPLFFWEKEKQAMLLHHSLIEKPNDTKSMEFGQNWTPGIIIHRIVFLLLVLISGRVNVCISPCHPL